MIKFNCDCGKKVRDVYFKNGNYMCSKCFWQHVDNPYDYLINMLVSKGLVVTYKNNPVLEMKMFSADFLEEKEKMVTPDESWITISGDEFWTYFNGTPENLRAYITDYSIKPPKEDCSDKEENEAAATESCSSSSCSSCSACSHSED